MGRRDGLNSFGSWLTENGGSAPCQCESPFAATLAFIAPAAHR
jgi:hypothetical protein